MMLMKFCGAAGVLLFVGIPQPLPSQARSTSEDMHIKHGDTVKFGSLALEVAAGVL